MKKTVILLLCAVWMFWPAKVQSQEPVVLQLRWDHQFQFAGYYAALWQGFYEEEGLDVEIRAALTADGDILSAVEEVSAGRADFGIGAADILLSNDQGQALSVAAVIFQQSAARFYLKQETPFSSPADFTRLRVARNENDLIDVELQAMLLKEGIDPQKVPSYPHQPGLDHLLNNQVQVIPGYRTTVPFFMDAVGVDYSEISPIDYGVDFYGDSIFTTFDLTQKEPELVEKFVRASIKGWQYALGNPADVADEISKKLERTAKLDDTLAFNLFQADAVHELTLYPIVDVGNINPYRWEKMHAFMREIGQVENDLNLEQFIFDPERIAQEREAAIQQVVFWSLGIFAILLVTGVIWLYALRTQVAQKTAVIRAEEEKFRVLTANAPNVIFATDTNLKITYINKTVNGSDPATVIGRHVSDLTPPDQIEFVLTQIETARTTLKPVNYEIVSKDEFGNYWLDVRLGPIMQHATVIGFTFILTDITERKRAEEELSQSETQLREVLDNMEKAIAIYEPVADGADFKFVDMNEFGEKITHLKIKDVLGKTITELFPGESSVGLIAKLRETWETGNSTQIPLKQYVDDRITQWVENFIFKLPSGKMVAMFEDTFEKRKAEMALLESEARFRQFFETNAQYCYMVSFDGNILDINQHALNILGYAKDEVLGKPLIQTIYAPESQAKARRLNEMWQQTGSVKNEELTLLSKSGGKRFVLLNVSSVRNSEGQIIHSTSVQTDITDRKQAEESLSREKELTQQYLDVAGVMLVALDVNQKVTVINPKGCEILGYSRAEIIGQNWFDHFLPSKDIDTIKQVFNQIMSDEIEMVEYYENPIVRKDGTKKIIAWHNSVLRDKTGEIIGLFSSGEDITARKRMEEETVRQERLTAVGQLSAGIAHDFNNILTSIIGFAELLKFKPNVPAEVHPDLTRIVEQGQRAAKLTRQILDFSRQTVNEPHPLDMKIYMNETLKFIERTIPETIRIQFNFAMGEYTINADPVQLQQVITNLAVNARDAMPNGGTLYFDLSRVNVVADEPPPCSDMEAGEWVRLVVTDTGSGIAPEILPHIFEPFFTTKEVGKGTGLGLAQIYGIVKQHNGCIAVDSQVGQGAAFALYFPALAAPTTVQSKTIETVPKGQGEFILLVEDEQAVREVAHTMLEMLNYRVITAQNGVDALAVYRIRAGEIALVLTDVVMPDMDGFALASALQTETPGIKIILMSGYARTPEIPANITARLQKPLTVRQLAQVLKEALD
jgi:two-component system cell cycle sensor histidine kinase/response regulator CckA